MPKSVHRKRTTAFHVGQNVQENISRLTVKHKPKKFYVLKQHLNVLVAHSTKDKDDS